MKVAIVGVSGLVGQTMLKVLAERNFPVDELLPVASKRSAGQEISFKGIKHNIIGLEEALKNKPDIALFSAGSSVSREWSPKMAEAGTTVIDNSSAWRMDRDVPLVVPEINADSVSKDQRIIANPNCSTIQLLMAVAPLHKRYGIKRMVISTYQSVTGSGQKAVEQLKNEVKGIKGDMVFPHPVFMNCIPHCDQFMDNGYTKEEIKLLNESRKILDDNTLQITATAVRVPVMGGHSESVNIELKNDFDLYELKEILENSPGVILRDDAFNNVYPMAIEAEGKDEVFVGRIRRDYSCKNSLNMWIVADNLRKGAATNAVQIAEIVLGLG